MSGKISGMVWDLDLPHNERLVLLSYADHCDHEGRNAHPSVELTAWKTGYDERTIQRVVKRLMETGLLVPEGPTVGGRGITTIFRVCPENGRKKPPFSPKSRAVKGDILSSERVTFCRETPVKGDILPQERVTNSTRKGDISGGRHYKERARLTVRETSVVTAAPDGAAAGDTRGRAREGGSLPVTAPAAAAAVLSGPVSRFAREPGSSLTAFECWAVAFHARRGRDFVCAEIGAVSATCELLLSQAGPALFQACVAYFFSGDDPFYDRVAYDVKWFIKQFPGIAARVEEDAAAAAATAGSGGVPASALAASSRRRRGRGAPDRDRDDGQWHLPSDPEARAAEIHEWVSARYEDTDDSITPRAPLLPASVTSAPPVPSLEAQS